MWCNNINLRKADSFPVWVSGSSPEAAVFWENASSAEFSQIQNTHTHLYQVVQIISLSPQSVYADSPCQSVAYNHHSYNFITIVHQLLLSWCRHRLIVFIVQINTSIQIVLSPLFHFALCFLKEQWVFGMCVDSCVCIGLMGSDSARISERLSCCNHSIHRSFGMIRENLLTCLLIK